MKTWDLGPALGIKKEADIEAAARVGDTVYLGFRAPLAPAVPGGKALVVPVTNIDRVVAGVAKPVFGEPLEMNLGGLAVRDIRKNTADQYLILAGSWAAGQLAVAVSGPDDAYVAGSGDRRVAGGLDVDLEEGGGHPLLRDVHGDARVADRADGPRQVPGGERDGRCGGGFLGGVGGRGQPCGEQGGGPGGSHGTEAACR
ncbi:hypothetical protein [Streptomyces sp. H34-S4]|uniref:hypothetical protein n=1 Tax=Streptomyces sp. H34-S4 TaxID=2996463 RepID=UPI002D1E3512|nr:hypothetical protein [Streptomyces sp. H34-S4]